MVLTNQNAKISPSISFDSKLEPQISSVVDDVLACSFESPLSGMFEDEGILM